jgi:hypothetical protein
MKLFYITTAEHMVDMRFAWHSLDLGDGELLVCVDWKDDAHEFRWSQTDGVIPLPHPIFEASTPLTDEHRQHLAGRYKTNSGDNIHHIIKQAAKEDLWMRVHVL